MALTDVAIRNAKPRAKPYKLGDSLGLFLLIATGGGKLWRLKYRIHGKEKTLAIGVYPQVGLADARRRRDEARQLLLDGKDPGVEKRRAKVRAQMQASNTFSAIAAEFCEKRKRDGQKGWAPATATRSEYLLSLLRGSIGNMPIAEIEPIDVLAAVRRIESKGKLESARRTLQLAGAVFRYAVATARLRSDPTRDLKGALTSPSVTHYGAILEPSRVGDLLRAIDGYDGQPISKLGSANRTSRVCAPWRAKTCDLGRSRFRKCVVDDPGSQDEDAKRPSGSIVATGSGDAEAGPCVDRTKRLSLPIDTLSRPAHERQHDQCRSQAPRLLDR